MNNPQLYVHVDHVERIGAQESLFDFGNRINWRSDRLDSVLDAGCGPGDTTVDILMPILPANFSRLVGVDISKEMIDYARKTYVHPKLSFELFDLDKDLEKQPFRNVKPFDHIFSFFTVMRIKNLGTYFRNFYKLLVPNGDFLVASVTSPLYDKYKEQSLNGKWASYLTDVDTKMPPFQNSKDPGKAFCDIINSYDFTDCTARVHHKNFIAENVDELRGMHKLVLHTLVSLFHGLPPSYSNRCIDLM